MSVDLTESTALIEDEEPSFMLGSGVFFVKTLKQLAEEPSCPPEVWADWQVLKEWLDCYGRELSQDDFEVVSKAWESYLAYGEAPSEQTQPIFEAAKKSYGESEHLFGVTLPPQEVCSVFDRLIATDDEITHQDFHNENSSSELELRSGVTESEFRELGEPESWWRSRSKMFRLWAFISITWIIVVALYEAIFDPFDAGRWGLENQELIQITTIALIPVLLGGIKYAYEKLVK